ncbi:dynein regulatory complex subunit 5 [Drosophila willistoni]|nr:dynein regulatory complex subunit 5 [Drosophila willistoni]
MMCDVGLPCDYDPCSCPKPPPVPGRKFTTLLLHCWQREYDKRPYKNFQFRRLDFEERMNRKYHCLRDFRVIVRYLTECHKMHSVSISSIVISNWETRIMREFVRALRKVMQIELKLMKLPYEFFVMMRLSASVWKVTHLSLEGTPLSDLDVSMLREFLLASETLLSLNVNHCGLTQYNFCLIADGVYKSKTVNCLNASRLLGLQLSLDTEKMVSIIGSLLMQNGLVELTMQQCEFSAQDMEVIGEYLGSKQSVLRKLNLASNHIAADGALYLMRNLAHGVRLEHLDISCNSIGTHGGEWIAKYLSSCRLLQHLYINYNEIGAEAINLILLTLKKPCKMKRLNIYGNHFDARTAMILRRLLDSEVVLHEEIDVSYTFDEDLNDYRVVPWR